jgi:dUTP pyrophosphatase
MSFRISRLEHGKDLPLPAYQSGGAAGMDLYAAISDEVTVKPGGTAIIGTGIVIALPPGYEGQVRPRSGLALKYGITVLNSPGTIDADYRGEVKVLIINHGMADYIVRHGDRIAQLLIARAEQIEWTVVPFIDENETPRKGGGYGSTGVSLDGGAL